MLMLLQGRNVTMWPFATDICATSFGNHMGIRCHVENCIQLKFSENGSRDLDKAISAVNYTVPVEDDGQIGSRSFPSVGRTMSN